MAKAALPSKDTRSKAQRGDLDQHTVGDIDSSASCSAMNNPQTLICG